MNKKGSCNQKMLLINTSKIKLFDFYSSSNEFTFGGFDPPSRQQRNQRPKISLRDLYSEVQVPEERPKFKPFKLQDLYNEAPELVIPEQPSRPPPVLNNGPALRRPKRKRPIFQNAISGLGGPIKKRYPGHGPRERFPSHERPTQFVDFRNELRPGNNRPLRKQFQERPQRVTTPRPIPTPGPGDFPGPPPGARVPRPPPTHPTHPPPITHPPEHYNVVTQKSPADLNPLFHQLMNHESPNTFQDSNNIEPFEDSSDYDYNDINDKEASDGFFEYPGTFPSLEDLGAGFDFESMKIRNKRSTTDAAISNSRKKRSITDEQELLLASEARRLLRNRRNRARGGNRRNRGRGGQGHQPRQGFNFRENFWDDDYVIANNGNEDFFSNFGGDSFANRNYNQGTGVRKQRYSIPTSNNNNNYQNYNNYQDTYRRDPYTEQTIQTYPGDNDYYAQDPFTGYDGAINNEILGSGNFEVIKGGTFYDDDTYYYSTYNQRPQYGQQFFENFRDFADIKNDRYNYYPKYR